MANVQELVDEILAIEHYGVKGQKWGQRNYQNPDGTYTELGKKRRRVGYEKSETSEEKEATKMGGKAYKDMTRKERKAAKRAARHNEKERIARRIFNKDKEDAINRADLDFITKNIDKFSDDELIKASERFKKIQMINEYNNLKKEEKARKCILLRASRYSTQKLTMLFVEMIIVGWFFAFCIALFDLLKIENYTPICISIGSLMFFMMVLAHSNFFKEPLKDEISPHYKLIHTTENENQKVQHQFTIKNKGEDKNE